jgi:hypothetical protein
MMPVNTGGMYKYRLTDNIRDMRIQYFEPIKPLQPSESLLNPIYRMKGDNVV